MNKPKIEVLQPEPHVPWNIDGSVLTAGIGDDLVVIDLEERQADSEVVIDVCRCPSGLMEGVCGAYVLCVKIPPRRYREEADETMETASEDVDGEEIIGGPNIILVPEPLDLASVVISLWTDEVKEMEDVSNDI